MTWGIIAAATIITVGTVYSVSATQQAGADAAEAQVAQTEAGIAYQREVRRDIQDSLNTFSYSFDPTNPYEGLQNHSASLENQFGNLQNHYANVDNAYESLTNTFDNVGNSYADLENNYGDLVNQYAGLETAFSDVENSFTSVSNPFAGQQVAQRDIDFRQKQSNQQLANVLDSVRESGATAASATALARESGFNTEQLAGELERRETANIQQFNQAEFQRQQLVAQGQQNIDFAAASATDRFSQLEAQGEQQLQFAQAGEQARLDTLAAQGAQQLDFARAAQDFDIQGLRAGEQSRLDTLVAQQSTANDYQSAQAQTVIDFRQADTQQQLDLAAAEGQVYVDSILRERDANRLDVNLAGYQVSGGTNQQVYSHPSDPRNNAPGVNNYAEQAAYYNSQYNSQGNNNYYGNPEDDFNWRPSYYPAQQQQQQQQQQQPQGLPGNIPRPYAGINTNDPRYNQPTNI